MTNPLLTAIIFTYNHETSIEKCIESLINQKTDYSYKIHIYDDCSIDNTTNICRKYAEKYPDKIELTIQKENTFLKPYLELQSYAAIKIIDTEYFCVIDGDDYWCDENKIQIALNFLEQNPEYIGFAHDAMQIDGFSHLSYIHEIIKRDITNPVTFNPDAPFFLTSSRIFRKCDYEKKKILPIDYLFYYYHLSKGPIYYYDKIMAVYVVGENSTFANLKKKTRNLNSMFSYKLSLLFDFQQDVFCTEMQKKYDKANHLGDARHRRLCLFKKIFGVKRGWTLWFIATFVWRYGFKCMDINYIQSHKKAKKRIDEQTKNTSPATVLKNMYLKQGTEIIDTLYKKYKNLSNNSTEYLNKTLKPTFEEIIKIYMENGKLDEITEIEAKYTESRRWIFNNISCATHNLRNKRQKYRKLKRTLFPLVIISILLNMVLAAYFIMNMSAGLT